MRRNIRAALKNGVRVEERARRCDTTETFYRLQGITRRRQGVPVQPRRYFDALWRNVIATKLGFLLVALVGDHPIAGAIFLEWNGTVVYKYGASDHSYWSLRPNDLIFWTAIQASLEKGHSTLDFGRSAFRDEGLKRYKSSWGAHELELAYTTFADRETSSSGAGHASADRAAQLIAPVIRRSPVWFARWLGTAFYKYAA